MIFPCPGAARSSSWGKQAAASPFAEVTGSIDRLSHPAVRETVFMFFQSFSIYFFSVVLYSHRQIRSVLARSICVYVSVDLVSVVAVSVKHSLFKQCLLRELCSSSIW